MTGKTEKPAVETALGPEQINGDAVADFLRRHPDFFTDRLDLLSEMSAPSRWTGDGVVDMQRYLADRRLGEIDDLRNCAQEVIETSRSNMSVQTRTHASVLAMMSATDIGQLLRVVSEDLPLLLDVDVVVLGQEPLAADTGVSPAAAPEVLQLPEGGVDRILGAEENVCLLRDLEDKIEFGEMLFGAASRLVRSAVLVRLRAGSGVADGILALGSRGDTFSPGQGTELAGFLARALELCLYRLAEPPG
ncbi:MAG TPA: DUF484 family protein [Rhodospirillales bacterium]|jgi:hypothetical protein|nr:DUF484 family protein [Rhodospirillales bacterium]